MIEVAYLGKFDFEEKQHHFSSTSANTYVVYLQPAFDYQWSDTKVNAILTESSK